MATIPPTRRPSIVRPARVVLLTVICVTAGVTVGCHKNPPLSARDIYNFSLTFPVPLPTATDSAPPDPPEIPLTNPAIKPATLIIPFPRIFPPRARTAGSEPEQPEAARPEAPTIAPQLSATEQAAAERDTQKDIKTAENNLQVAYGKPQLNAAQRDLVEKIQSFLAQAREAIRERDWVRARNLAQKARVLSLELINSL